MTDPKASWKKHLLSKYKADLDAYVSSQTEPNLDSLGWERLDRIHWLDFAHSIDPNATLQEEFIVRLVGANADSAAFRLEWDAILKPFRDALLAINEGASLELSGFSKGSSVLHFRSASRPAVEHIAGNSDASIYETPLASPARQFIELVDAAEGEHDLRPWADSTALECVEKLSEEMDNLALEAEFRYYTRGGDVRGTRLSRRGMVYLQSLAEEVDRSIVQNISGRITELRASGHAKVKAGTSRNATAFDVKFEADQLTGMHLVLGQNVHWAVITTSNEDKLGRLRSIHYSFSRDLGIQEQKDLASDHFWNTDESDENS